MFVLMDVCAEAYDALDPLGNVTIKWDVISWTPDGYVVSIYELQLSFYVIFLAFIRCFRSRIMIELDLIVHFSSLVFGNLRAFLR